VIDRVIAPHGPRCARPSQCFNRPHSRLEDQNTRAPARFIHTSRRASSDVARVDAAFDARVASDVIRRPVSVSVARRRARDARIERLVLDGARWARG